MEDIIFSVAWTCGDRDCASQWHKADYWMYDDGTYSIDNYSDGDHEDVEESDVPPYAEVDASWREYAKYVVQTGSDPLSEYFVKHATKVEQRWRFRFNNSIIGPVLLEAKHGNRSYVGRELPEHVRRYLNLDQTGRRLTDFADWAAFVEVLPGIKPMRWTTITIEHNRPRAEAAVNRELRRLARRTLKAA